MNQELSKKYEALKKYMASLGSIAVAFSSGVDSTLLLYAAREALGDKMIAITASSGTFPARETKEAVDYCRTLGIRHFLIETDELKIPGFAQNPPNRCYICKKEIFTQIKELASKEGMAEVAEGSNMDDLGDYRPGLVAVEELGIKSPLRQASLYKSEIRQISKELGLPTWEKASFACLASRFPYGDLINEKKLKMVEEAEEYLLGQGFHQFRVRIHEKLARIELEQKDFEVFMRPDLREQVYLRFKEIGFDYVSLDLKGYRTGSMNETLQIEG